MKPSKDVLGEVALCMAMLGAVGCGSELPDPFIPALEKHMGQGDPALDTSNKYIGNPAAIALGKKFYFDKNFSGLEVSADMLLRPMTTPGRAATGAPIRVACNTCHEVAQGGTDHTANPPGNVVSFGGGAYDVNSQPTINAAFDELIYWNGRNDSLWSQIVAVTESHVSVNGSRLRVAWRIADAYRAEYAAVFGEYPLPTELDGIAAQQARLEPDGTCTLEGGTICPAVCSSTMGACLPRFPLEGRPGFVSPGELPTCDRNSTETILQPYRDAWDCMDLADQLLITRVYVNYAKAIAAYEYTLISRNAPFDGWAAAGFPAGMLGASAERGARLFVGKAACAECHAGPNFSDSKFHVIGVPQLGPYVPKTTECPAGDVNCDCVTDDRFDPTSCLPIGARDGIRKLQGNRFRRDSLWSDDEECRRHFTVHTDVNYAIEHPLECDGRVKYYSMPLTDALRGAWKTPRLRDVALTGPYMHDGVHATLRAVVEHYNKGGKSELGGEAIGKLDDKIKELNLTTQEIDDLVAFLESLTGTVDAAVIAEPVVPPDSAF